MKHKFLFLLFSVLFAFAMWTYVVTVVSPESESTFHNIPVIFNNEAVLTDKGLMIVSDKDVSMTLRLRGNRSDLNRLRNSDITIIADLSKINAPGEQTLHCSISFTGNGNNNAFEVLSQEPNVVTLEIAEWTTKEIPVNVRFDGALDMDYIAYQDEAQLNHSHITITGPKVEVDQITQAVIPVNLSGRVDTIREEFDYLLCNEAGQEVDATSVATNVEKIYYTLKIQLVKEIQLLVNVIYGGGATQDTASVVLSNQSIKISGSEKQLEGLGSITLGTVDLSTIAENTVISFPLVLPEGIVNISGITEVTADITFPRLKVREMYVSNITLINMPEGMQADIDTKRMKVTLRGPDVLMNAIQPESVSIVVDMTQAELGTNLYKAQIVLDDTVYEGVGAIGSYTVTVTLTQAPPPVEEMP